MEKTERLYDLDSSLRQCSALVRACRETEKGYEVLLSATCFFPEGGGQPADRGTIGGAAVKDVQLREGEVIHLCDGPLEPGSRVECLLDYERRFLHMQTHCGEHILSGMVLREYGLHNVGFHMGEGYNTVDFDGEMTPEMCRQVEELVNRAIWENVPVKVWYPDGEALEKLPLRKKPEVDEPLRVVEIPGLDCCCCCGTHTAATGQIGLLRITDQMRYKGGARLTFVCGLDALRASAGEHTVLRELGTRFSCKPEQVPQAVGRLEEELGLLKNALAGKGRHLARLLALRFEREAVEKDGVRYCLGEARELDPGDCKTLALSLAEQENTVAFVLGGGATPRYVLAKHPDTPADLQAICRRVNEAFSGKGGGSALLCQGTLSPALFGAVKEVILA